MAEFKPGEPMYMIGHLLAAGPTGITSVVDKNGKNRLYNEFEARDHLAIINSGIPHPVWELFLVSRLTNNSGVGW